jgi:hypothetical protein
MKEEQNNPLTEEQKSSMRAFLQRAEVRLSTMHRVASAFISGAGLLILFPFLINSALPQVLKDSFNNSVKSADEILLLISIFFTILIPLLAIFYLLKDLVLFYFTGHIPGFNDDNFTPRYALTALSLPNEESNKTIKDRIKDLQEKDDIINFVVPQSKKYENYFKKILKKYSKKVIPESRQGDFSNGNGEENPFSRKDYFLVALGLAGFEDRDLIHSVAKMEASLVRHSLFLRRLVLRYMKALILVICTLIVAIFAHQIVEYNINGCKSIIVSIVYGVWGILSYFVVRWPIDWIFYYTGNPSHERKKVFNDPNLVRFELLSTLLGFSISILCMISIIINLSK